MCAHMRMRESGSIRDLRSTRIIYVGSSEAELRHELERRVRRDRTRERQPIFDLESRLAAVAGPIVGLQTCSPLGKEPERCFTIEFCRTSPEECCFVMFGVLLDFFADGLFLLTSAALVERRRAALTFGVGKPETVAECSSSRSCCLRSARWSCTRSLYERFALYMCGRKRV